MLQRKPRSKVKRRRRLTLRNRLKLRLVMPSDFRRTLEIRPTLSPPLAYSHKFFNKLTEAEKWDLEQDLPNSMLNNAWGKAEAESSKIQNFKKEIGQFCDQLLVKRKVPPSSPQVSRRKLAIVSTWILRVD
jgi:hypothetical protein